MGAFNVVLLEHAEARAFAQATGVDLLNHVSTDEVHRVLVADSALVDPRKYIKSARSKVAEEATHLLQLLALIS